MVDRFRLGYRPALNGVRAIAILPVIAFHYRRSDLALPTRGGFLGVEVFFVLSGFLITSLLCEELEKTGRLRLKLFYARRALRLLPALFTMVAVYLLWVVTLGPDRLIGAQLKEAAGALFYIENWLRAFVPNHAVPPPNNGLVPTWSLSAEEQFYAFWPILLVLFIRFRGLRAASIFAASALAFSALFRAIVYDGRQWQHFFFIRPDALLAGCLLALLLAQGIRWSPSRWIAWAAATTVALFLIGADWSSYWLFRFGFFAFAIACAIAIWGVVTKPDWLITRLLEREPLVGIGKISYGLYLWHMPAFVFVEKYLPHVSSAAPAALALTFAVTIASYRFIEMPFLRLKGRLNPVRPPGPQASPKIASVPAPGVSAV